MNIKSIGIITSGGDCGGLNAVVKGAASMALGCGITPYAIPNGYAGLYNLSEMGNLIELNEARLEDIKINMAGSLIGNSRVKISKINDEKKYERIKDGLKKYGIDALLISGGDDSGSVVLDLCGKGIPCVHVPKTMDLDLHTYSVGGDSTVNRLADYISDLKTTGVSHNRITIVEAFGRYAGHVAFCGGIAGEADCILLPEITPDFDVIYEDVKQKLFSRIGRNPYKGGTYVIVVSEALRDDIGALLTDESCGADAFGHKKLVGTGKYVRDKLYARIKRDPEITEFMKRQGAYIRDICETLEIRETLPGYLMRSGKTSAVDSLFGYSAGAGGVQLLVEGIHGVTVTSVENGTVKYIEIQDAIKQRYVSEGAIAFYEKIGFCFGRKPHEYKQNSIKCVKADWIYF